MLTAAPSRYPFYRSLAATPPAVLVPPENEDEDKSGIPDNFRAPLVVNWSTRKVRHPYRPPRQPGQSYSSATQASGPPQALDPSHHPQSG